MAKSGKITFVGASPVGPEVASVTFPALSLGAVALAALRSVSASGEKKLIVDTGARTVSVFRPRLRLRCKIRLRP